MERKDKLAIGLCLASAVDTVTTKIALTIPGASDLNPLIENHYFLSNTDEILMVKMGVIVMFAGIYSLSRKWEDASTQNLLGKTLLASNIILWSAAVLNTVTLIQNH